MRNHRISASIEGAFPGWRSRPPNHNASISSCGRTIVELVTEAMLKIEPTRLEKVSRTRLVLGNIINPALFERRGLLCKEPDLRLMDSPNVGDGGINYCKIKGGAHLIKSYARVCSQSRRGRRPCLGLRNCRPTSTWKKVPPFLFGREHKMNRQVSTVTRKFPQVRICHLRVYTCCKTKTIYNTSFFCGFIYAPLHSRQESQFNIIRNGHRH